MPWGLCIFRKTLLYYIFKVDTQNYENARALIINTAVLLLHANQAKPDS